MTQDAATDGASYDGRTVVVTGGYGYLGTAMSARLRAAGASVRRVTRGRAETVGDPERWQGDLLDASFVRELVAGATTVFHFAGQTSVNVAEEHPLDDLRANLGTTLALLDACSRTRACPHFVYSGTATAIGVTTELPIPVQTPDRPSTVYDVNKLAAEHHVRVYAERGAVHGVTLRIANVYGPGAAKSAPDRGVTNRLVGRALAGHALTYYGDGLLARDYVFIDDLIDAFFRAGCRADRATQSSYVVSGGRAYTFREAFGLMADVVAELGRPRVDVVGVPWPHGSHPIDKRSFLSDPTSLAEWLAWKPSTSLREGLLRTARHLLAEQLA